jgi:hypothetical protein
MKSKIMVFGSNERGAHGKGAALYAKQHYGAIYGQAYGLQGLSFAIPTKDAKLKTLPLQRINDYVDRFLVFAKKNQQYKFLLTPIGCGLAGLKYEDVAPMFANVPDNITLPEEFKQVLDRKI